MLKWNAFPTFPFFSVKILGQNYKLIYVPEFGHFIKLGKTWMKSPEVFNQCWPLTPLDITLTYYNEEE